MKPRQVAVFIAVFILTQLLSVFFGWLTGYNFDYRAPEIAMWFGMGLVIGLMAAGIAAENFH